MSPTLVLLHGFGTSKRLWDGLALPEGSTLALDLPGFGDSQDDRFTVDGMADAVEEAVRGLDAYLLVGHSMGGKVAAVLAARRPTGLAGLVLVAPSPLSPEPMTDDDRQALKDAYGQPDKLRAHYRQITKAPVQPAALAQLITDGKRGSHAAWDAWPDAGSREDRRAEAAQIQVPVWLLTSQDDPVISPQVVAEQVIPSFPQATHTTLQGSGHLLPLELPASVASVLSAALHALKQQNP